MKEEVLQLLRRAEGDCSGEEMSRRLQVSRSAVWKSVQALRRDGYEIQSSTNRGYRLIRGPETLTESEVRANLEGCPWAPLVQVLPRVVSTNDMAKTLASGGAPEGTVIAADCQTGGRGRMGRSFQSPAGMGVYLSVILRPQLPPDKLLHLTCAAAVAVRRAVEDACGFAPDIKWANDLISNGRKLVGILTELSLEAESGSIQYAVIGVGINCGQNSEDFPEELRRTATSLRQETGVSPDRNRLAAAMVRRLAELSASVQDGPAAWLDEYRRSCVTLGRRVVLISAAGERRYAQAVDVEPDGALLVEREDGTRERVNTGEVSVRGMYGYV